MILDSYIKVEVKRANVRFYKEKYNCKVGDYINVEIIDLPKGTNLEVFVKCDICGMERMLMYRKYLKNINCYDYYSCSSKCSTNKKKLTCLEKYGVDNPNKNDIVKKQKKLTCLEKYGVDNPNKSIFIKNKTKKTCLEKYGNVSYVNSFDFKNKMNEKYGVVNPMMSYLINDKRIKTSFKINEFDSIKYQGKYELDFLKFCKENNIKVNRPNFNINYVSLQEDKKYLPDFYIEELNLVIEIKSTYYFNLHKEKNLLKKKYTIKFGYEYMLILDKNYKEFINYYEENINI
jgi:transcription elongation factor Elf1